MFQLVVLHFWFVDSLLNSQVWYASCIRVYPDNLQSRKTDEMMHQVMRMRRKNMVSQKQIEKERQLGHHQERMQNHESQQHAVPDNQMASGLQNRQDCCDCRCCSDPLYRRCHYYCHCWEQHHLHVEMAEHSRHQKCPCVLYQIPKGQTSKEPTHKKSKEEKNTIATVICSGSYGYKDAYACAYAPWICQSLHLHVRSLCPHEQNQTPTYEATHHTSTCIHTHKNKKHTGHKTYSDAHVRLTEKTDRQMRKAE